MKLTESKKMAEVLAQAHFAMSGRSGYLVLSAPRNRKYDIRHFTFQDGEFFPYGKLNHEEELKKAIKLGSTKKKGDVFFADVKNLRCYIVADSEEEACEVAKRA